MWARRLASSSLMFATGMPVMSARASATDAAVIVPSISLADFFQFFRIWSRSRLAFSSRSRNDAAFSYSWLRMLSSLSRSRRAISSSSADTSGGLVDRRRRSMEQVSSMTSIALSGSWRPGRKRCESSTAEAMASSRIRTRWWASYESRKPFRISTVCSGVGGSMIRVWKRRSMAPSFSTCLRYSSSVVAPMHWISPRDSDGFRMLEASSELSDAPAPISVWISSMNRIMFFAAMTSAMIVLSRFSNSPRYFVPARIAARSRLITRLLARISGTSLSAIFCASPSTMAVLPTPGSPSTTGLFFVLRLRIWINRWISRVLPITGSSLFMAARSVRSMPNDSRNESFFLSCVAVKPKPWPDSCESSGPPPPPRSACRLWRSPAASRPDSARMRAATPSSSRASPSNRCSVPTKACPDWRASSPASSRQRLAFGVKGTELRRFLPLICSSAASAFWQIACTSTSSRENA